MLCRRPACAYRHPDLCASPTCIPTRAPDCVKFHGRFKEDKEDKDSNADKKGSNPAKTSSHRPAQGNGRRGGPPQNRISSGRSNNRRFPSSSAPRRGVCPLLHNASRRELHKMRKELASIKRLSIRPSPPVLPSMGSSHGSSFSYSDAVKSSGRAPPQLNSFATVFSAALETALGTAGLMLSTC